MHVTIDNDVDIGVVVSNDVDIDLDVDDNTIDLAEERPPYTGSYVVTPSFLVQELETASKRMTDDVTVLDIPFSCVSNVYGGETVTIG